MFSIKYVYPTGQEHISGPYDTVTSEWVDAEGKHLDLSWPEPDGPPHVNGEAIGHPYYRVVYAYEYRQRDTGAHPDIQVGANMTFGPEIYAGDTAPTQRRRGRVYVMNDQGATVAKYEL